MTFQMFVVASRSAGRFDPMHFLLEPAFGVMALASAYTESTSRIGVAAEIAQEIVRYVALGLAPSIANVPGLTKHEQPPLDYFTSARLAASLRLADERLASARVGGALVTSSAAAIHADGAVARVVCAGPALDVWLVRGTTPTALVRSAAGAGTGIGEGIGTGAPVAILERDVALGDGDVVAIGVLDEDDAAFVAERAARVDDVLTGLLARSAGARVTLVGRLCVP